MAIFAVPSGSTRRRACLSHDDRLRAGHAAHLIGCTVVETAGPLLADDSARAAVGLVPAARVVHASIARALLRRARGVRFSGVRGDFEENEGVWELLPRRYGAATVVTYRAQVVPRSLALATLKRDLPALLQGLRTRCQAP